MLIKKSQLGIVQLAPLVILVVLLIGLMASVAFLKDRKDIRSDARSVDDCIVADQRTNLFEEPLSNVKAAGPDLANTTKELRNFKQDLTKAKQLAVGRKSQLITAMRTNPKEALANIMPEDPELQQQLSPKCFETYTTIEGTLQILHADYPKTNSSKYLYRIQTAKDTYVTLHLANDMPRPITSGMQVRASGYRIDNDMVADGTNPHSLQLFKTPTTTNIANKALNASPASPNSGIQNTLVVLVNFTDTPKPNLTKETINDFVFKQVNGYYQENSYGIVSLSGTTLGWYPIPLSSKTCDTYSTTQAAIKAVDNVVDFTQYQQFVVIAPFNCGWGGLAYIGGGIPITTNDGENISIGLSYVSADSAGLYVLGHELGHSFGVHHANRLFCDDEIVASNNCQQWEYGDAYDIMGSGTGHFNVPHKSAVNWLRDKSLTSVKQSGTYTIAPLEINNDTNKGLMMPRYSVAFNDGLSDYVNKDYLYFEYRKPIGFDSNLIVQSPSKPDSSPEPSPDIFDGALVHTHITQEPTLNTFYGDFFQTYLLDMTPLKYGDGTKLYDNKFALLAGKTFTDPASGTAVTVTNKTDNNLVLSVSLGKTDLTPPTVAMTAPTDGSTVSGNTIIKANASHPAGIDKVEFYIYKDTSQAVMIGTAVNAPYEITWDSTSILNGQVSIVAVAYDKTGKPWNVLGNQARSSAKWLFVANGPKAAEMLNPAPNTVLPEKPVVFSWSYGNDITRYMLYVGSAKGAANYFNGAYSTTISAAITSLPQDGSPIYVRLWSYATKTGWMYHDYAYTAAGTPFAKAELTSPTVGSIIKNSTQTFTWTTGSKVSYYYLFIGSSVGASNIYASPVTYNTAITVPRIPTNGSNIYVRLYSYGSKGWQYNDYVFQTAKIPIEKASMLTPANKTTLTGSTVQFAWTPGNGALQYKLIVGTSLGYGNITSFTATSDTKYTVKNMPTTGIPIYVRLYTYLSTGWQYNDYSYTTFKSR